jgi:hypothetical protein
VTSEAAGEDEPEMTPFSLSDLGLTAEEIENLTLDESPLGQQPDDGLHLTEAELDSMDFPIGEQPAAPEQAAPQPAETAEPDELPMPEIQPVAEAQPPAAEEWPQQPELPPIAEPAQELEQPAEPSHAPRGADEALDLTAFQAQVEAEPNNHPRRLALARMSDQVGDLNQALDQYKHLIKSGELLDPVIEDLREMTERIEDPKSLHRIHRMLGDAYSKQSRWREAMDEYSWVLTKPRV